MLVVCPPGGQCVIQPGAWRMLAGRHHIDDTCRHIDNSAPGGLIPRVIKLTTLAV